MAITVNKPRGHGGVKRKNWARVEDNEESLFQLAQEVHSFYENEWKPFYEEEWKHFYEEEWPDFKEQIQEQIAQLSQQISSLQAESNENGNQS